MAWSLPWSREPGASPADAVDAADSVPAGLAKARAAIASGAALAKLEQMVTRTHALAGAAA